MDYLDLATVSRSLRGVPEWVKHSGVAARSDSAGETAPDARGADSALALAGAIRAGQQSSVEVLDDSLSHISRRDAEIRAFNFVCDESARRDAERVDALVAKGADPGPLAGVPIVLKDNICTRGIPTTCSSRILEGWIPPYDATVVSVLREAGAVIIGKTNLDEFAMGSSTENSAFGPTRNPRNLSRVPGGSSGGTAAAVAAEFAPLGLGSDTGGSVRQPASFCGAVGMKPTYGAVSRYGLIAYASSLDQIGPIAANVADAALLFDVLSGHDPLDSTSIEIPLESALASVGQGVDGLRVGMIRELCGMSDALSGISDDVLNRTRSAASALERNGATVKEISIPSIGFALSAYYLVAPAEASSNLARFDGIRYGLRVHAGTVDAMTVATRTAGFGDEVKRRIMLGTFALSAGYYDAYYGRAQKVRTLLQREFAAAYEQVDVLLTPTYPTTAFRLGEITDPLEMYLGDVCNVVSNLVGHPAISVPAGLGQDGLPIGVQILAPAMRDDQTFRTAAVIEAADWP